MKERDFGIDLMKFLAVLLITNSHMDLLYGQYAFLGTGGTMGNALFFFCSGFTLFLKPLGTWREFPDWYKRRINRIYPSVLAFAIIACIFFNSHLDTLHVIWQGGGWFIPCIMVFYIFLFFTGAYLKNKILWVELLVAALTGICFLTAWGRQRFFTSHLLYDVTSDIRWLLFFIFMLFGAQVGTFKDRIIRRRSDILLWIVSIIVFYAFFIPGRMYPRLYFLEYISIVPMLGFLFYSYKVFSSNRIKQLLGNKFIYGTIMCIGGLCLEIYLVQFSLITDKMNNLFPLNIVLIFMLIVVVAYLTRCFARIISQTFSEQSYNWKKIIALY